MTVWWKKTYRVKKQCNIDNVGEIISITDAKSLIRPLGPRRLYARHTWPRPQWASIAIAELNVSTQYSFPSFLPLVPFPSCPHKIVTSVTAFPKSVCTESGGRRCTRPHHEPSLLPPALDTLDPMRQKCWRYCANEIEVKVVYDDYLSVRFYRNLVMQNCLSTSLTLQVGLEERQTRILVLKYVAKCWWICHYQKETLHLTMYSLSKNPQWASFKCSQKSSRDVVVKLQQMWHL